MSSLLRGIKHTDPAVPHKKHRGYRGKKQLIQTQTQQQQTQQPQTQQTHQYQQPQKKYKQKQQRQQKQQQQQQQQTVEQTVQQTVQQTVDQTVKETVAPVPVALPVAVPVVAPVQQTHHEQTANSRSGTPKKKIPVALREQVWLKQMGRKFEGKCSTTWCKNTITVFDFQSGHNIPESKGGPTNLENLFPLCGRCNLSMGNEYTLDEWSKIYESPGKVKKKWWCF